MEVPTIQMPQDEARRAFEHYRTAVKARLTAEDEAIMAGYQAILRGQQVVDLLAVMRGCGLDAQGCPKLAIIRADARECWLRIRSDRSAQFAMDRWARSSRRRHIDLPPGTLPEGARPIYDSHSAIVPTIPPHLRPSRTALDKFDILWEANWRRIAPKDPMLLRRLRGYLYAVVATWDLTEVEQAVLNQRNADTRT